MKLLITSDLHYNHGKSRALADEIIDQINRERVDALLLIGDTAVADGNWLEQCLRRFRFDGPKLFVAGNHELWTNRDDSYALYTQELPRRVRELGWHWLEGSPVVIGPVAIAGSIGWYDYSFAQPNLRIPRRFYEHKVSPGAAAHDSEFAFLLENGGDVPEHALEVVARWNDGRFVKLHRSDEQFLNERLHQLEADLQQVSGATHVVAAIHHLPFVELLPPPHTAQWDFAKAYLGSAKIGDLLLRFRNVAHVFCGHSHYAAQARVGHIDAVSLGSGYRSKVYRVLEIN